MVAFDRTGKIENPKCVNLQDEHPKEAQPKPDRAATEDQAFLQFISNIDLLFGISHLQDVRASPLEQIHVSELYELGSTKHKTSSQVL